MQATKPLDYLSSHDQKTNFKYPNKNFLKGVRKGKCSLSGAYVSIKKARMESTQLEVGNSCMLFQRI